jgi:hypothetical protein
LSKENHLEVKMLIKIMHPGFIPLSIPYLIFFTFPIGVDNHLGIAYIFKIFDLKKDEEFWNSLKS